MNEHTRDLFRRESDAAFEAERDARDCEESLPPEEDPDDATWWAAQNTDHHDEPPGPAYHVAYLPGLTGRPGIYGPWCVCRADATVHSGWMFPGTAGAVLCDLERRRDDEEDGR